MNLYFERLQESHFPLLLEWLEKPHVKKWWDQDIVYTLDLVREKFLTCVTGLRDNKKIEGYIAFVDKKPIAYLQAYNAYDFPRSKELKSLPKSLGAIDIFIGDEKSLGQNLGSKIMIEFLAGDLFEYDNCFVDPDINNMAAIKCYEKAGFKKVAEQKDTNEVWMVRGDIV